MFILGAGAAHPDNVLTGDTLASLGVASSSADQALLGRFGVRTRRTTLPLEYLRSTKNPDVLEARKVATATPTSLATLAAKEALSRAGISPEQLGLIIADCATPYQTCPSEAHRIGGALGLKVPAYDVTAGLGAIPLFLDMLCSWKPERVPEYVLCVSTNTPTQQVRYGSDTLSALVFGDAASALVISAQHQGKLKIQSSFVERDGSVRPPVSIVRSISISTERLVSEEVLRDRLSASLLRLGAKRGAYLVGPQLFAGDCRCIAKSLSISEQQVISPAVEGGFALGASAGCAIATLWPNLRPGEQVALLHDGDGISSGALLEAV